MYLLVLFAPLISFIFSLLFGSFIGKSGIMLLSVGGMGLSFFGSVFIYYEVCLLNSTCLMSLYSWMDLGLVNLEVVFYFDVMVAIMLFMVSFMSLLVHMYSMEYMSYDPSFNSFIAYLSLFTFFMFLLLSADNFVQMFFGWEGVGLASYLLISFWYTSFLANKAAMKAMLMNSMGDLSLLIAVSILFLVFGSLKYAVVFNICYYFFSMNMMLLGVKFNLFYVLCLFLFMGAAGKSAQLGLHTWLPDAMEGPTPVSALMHAATMVTAGVFLVISCSYLFEQNKNILVVVGLVGGLTCLFSAIMGSFQFDMKKIVAYSTCSQLGYMFFSSGMSNYSLSLFHLFNHAFFKALLFLSMGSIIHALMDEQDFRKMGGLVRLLPFTYTMVVMGSLALMGFPFLTGFYSKDFILEFTFVSYSFEGFFFYFLGAFAAFFSAYYSMSLVYWVFLSKPNFPSIYLNTLHEPGLFMMMPLLLLGFCSVFVGYLFSDSMNGMGSNFYGNSVYHSLLNYEYFEAEFGLFFIKYLPLVFTILGVSFFFVFNYDYRLFKWLIFKTNYIFVYKFFMSAMYFDILYVDFLFNSMLKMSYLYMYKFVEKSMMDFIFVVVIYNMLWVLNNLYKKATKELIFDYFFMMIFFFVYLLLFLELYYYVDFMYFMGLIVLFFFNMYMYVIYLK